jgi:L-aspartate oxidase
MVNDFSVRFPGITAMLASHGLAAERDLLPVAPALHYAMGGVQTDLEGRTTKFRLWAVGEVARTGVHGANRLASNSLLEGLVFADRAGRALARALRSSAPQLPLKPGQLIEESGADSLSEDAKSAMRQLMTANVGLQRSESSLLHAEQELARLINAVPQDAWRTHNQLMVAQLITTAARRRRESRGGHRRTDYPPASFRREPV